MFIKKKKGECWDFQILSITRSWSGNCILQNYGRIFVDILCLIKVCLSLSDQAMKITTLKINYLLNSDSDITNGFGKTLQRMCEPEFFYPAIL